MPKHHEGHTMTIRMNQNHNYIADFMQTVQLNYTLDSQNIKWADINKRDESGHNALYWAIFHKNMLNLVILLATDCSHIVTKETHALFHAIDCGNTAAFFQLMDHGADINYCDKDGKTLLMHAIECEQAAIVKYLLHNKVDVNIIDKKSLLASDYAESCNDIQIQQFVYNEIFFGA